MIFLITYLPYSLNDTQGGFYKEDAISVAITIISFLGVALYFYLKYNSYELKNVRKYSKPFDIKQLAVLKKYFQYYNYLSPTDQKKFENRVHKFVINKRFLARRRPEVTDKMKVMIAASAVQLTFGLPEIHFSHFRTIIVYPEKYYSYEGRSVNIGEVHHKGVIVLSWKDFIKGYAIPDDSLNVGLHEMAHALLLENKIPNIQYRFLDRLSLSKLSGVSKREIERIRKGKQTFLRKYAGINSMEFFAVSVEYFFEQPTKLQKEIPDLYDALSKLLNQNPLAH
ncbi:MAG: zinc-dependent peptidase [Cytophagales bacterium]|nr:zinc-dependent peptidase [Cytophagales bacterium]